MVADFLVPYLVTIAGVVTTGVAAFALRWIWRYFTAPDPTLLRLELSDGTVKVINRGDFTVYLLRVEALPPAPNEWAIDYERPRRTVSGTWTSITLAGVQLRVDRDYRVVARDEHRARWEVTYAADPALSNFDGAGPTRIVRLWPALLRWLSVQSPSARSTG